MKIRITYRISDTIIGERNLYFKKLVELVRLVYSNNNVISYIVVESDK